MIGKDPVGNSTTFLKREKEKYNIINYYIYSLLLPVFTDSNKMSMKNHKIKYKSDFDENLNVEIFLQKIGINDNILVGFYCLFFFYQ